MARIPGVKVPVRLGLPPNKFGQSFHPQYILDREGAAVVMICGLPVNCTMEEIKSHHLFKEHYAVPLALGERIVELLNQDAEEQI